MKAKYLKIFAKATYSIMCELLGTEQILCGKIYLKEENRERVMGLVAIIGLTGQAEGQVMLDMEEQTALRIAGKINGEEFSEVDKMVQATIQELANMLAGRAITELQSMGFTFDITPPAIFIGKEMQVFRARQDIFILPLETDLGKVELNISISDRLGRTG